MKGRGDDGDGDEDEDDQPCIYHRNKLLLLLLLLLSSLLRPKPICAYLYYNTSRKKEEEFFGSRGRRRRYRRRCRRRRRSVHKNKSCYCGIFRGPILFLFSSPFSFSAHSHPPISCAKRIRERGGGGEGKDGFRRKTRGGKQPCLRCIRRGRREAERERKGGEREREGATDKRGKRRKERRKGLNLDVYSFSRGGGRVFAYAGGKGATVTEVQYTAVHQSFPPDFSSS